MSRGFKNHIGLLAFWLLFAGICFLLSISITQSKSLRIYLVVASFLGIALGFFVNNYSNSASRQRLVFSLILIVTFSIFLFAIASLAPSFAKRAKAISIIRDILIDLEGIASVVMASLFGTSIFSLVMVITSFGKRDWRKTTSKEYYNDTELAKIRYLISKSRTKTAISEMMKLADIIGNQALLDELVVISGRFSATNKKYRVDSEVDNVEINKIHVSLIQLLDEFMPSKIDTP